MLGLCMGLAFSSRVNWSIAYRIYGVSSMGVGGLGSTFILSAFALFEDATSVLLICSSSKRTTRGVFEAYAASLTPTECLF